MGLLKGHKQPTRGPSDRLWLAAPLLFVLGFAADAILHGGDSCRAITRQRMPDPAAAAAAVISGSSLGGAVPAAAATSGGGTDSAAATVAAAAAAVKPDAAAAGAANQAPATAAAAAAGASCPVPGADRTKLRSKDFVYAGITHCARAPLVSAHRVWREGMPAFITVDCDAAGVKALNDANAEHKETYAFYRNVTEAEKGVLSPSAGLGYLRAGMTPTLAHRHFGPSYKWMLWGDDDTLFLMPPILRELENLDPEKPWVFNDFCGWAGEFYPRCIPCTYDDTGIDVASALAVKSCTCKTTDDEAEFAAAAAKYKHKVYPWRRMGGSGYVISVGFMKQVGIDNFEACLQKEATRSPGGDIMFSECMPKAGFRFADFGWTIRHRLKFPQRMVNQFGLYDREQFMKTITGATAGSCDDVCQAELAGGTSVHIVSKELPDIWQTAHSYVVNATKLYNKYAVEKLGLSALTSQC